MAGVELSEQVCYALPRSDSDITQVEICEAVLARLRATGGTIGYSRRESHSHTVYRRSESLGRNSENAEVTSRAAKAAHEA